MRRQAQEVDPSEDEAAKAKRLASAEEDATVQRQIKGWLQSCMQARRFCPQDPGPFSCDSNICCYVTGDGDEAGGPRNEKDTVLRIAKAKIRDDLFTAVAERIRVHYGVQLHDTCHMGPDESVYKNALDDLMYRFDFDFRRLLGENIFSAKFLLAKLGLRGELPGIEDHSHERPAPEFIRKFSFMQNEEVVSQGVGVHAFALLLCVSMTLGPTLHPKVSSDFTRTVLSEILRFSPVAATPGDSILVRSFDLITTTPERIQVEPAAAKRPEHFLRPTDDLQFATKGTFTVGRVTGRHPPEDLLHAGFLPPLAALLHCSILEVPGSEVFASYEIVPDRPYAVWAPKSRRHGSLVASTETRAVLLSMCDHDQDNGDVVTLRPDEWEPRLRKLGATLPPMVWRSGACVLITEGEDTAIGVLVPHPSGFNFCPLTCQYRVMVGQATHVIGMMFWDVLDCLVPVGQALVLSLKLPPHAELREQVPPAWREYQKLQVRLNVPPMANPEPGKVYVTYLVKHNVARSDSSDLSAATVAVDPWHLAQLDDEPAAAYVFARRRV